MQITGAQALIKSLEQVGVDTIFGLPGGAILPVYDPLIDSTIRHILVRHEQGAGHMAEGYALATGKPGVAMVTSGPGATNIVTPIANAYMDSTPLVVITGQVPTANIGTDAFQECDTVGITRPIVKHNFLVKDVRELPEVMKKAFHIARSGRPGPVHVELPRETDESEYILQKEKAVLPAYKRLPTVVHQPQAADVAAVAAPRRASKCRSRWKIPARSPWRTKRCHSARWCASPIYSTTNPW